MAGKLWRRSPASCKPRAPNTSEPRRPTSSAHWAKSRPANSAADSANGPRPVPPQPASPDAPITPDPLEEIKDEEEISAKYLSMFLDEAEASLEAFGSGLLALEGAGNSDGLKALVGIAHKIKGSAASVGLHRAAKLTAPDRRPVRATPGVGRVHCRRRRPTCCSNVPMR